MEDNSQEYKNSTKSKEQNHEVIMYLIIGGYQRGRKSYLFG